MRLQFIVSVILFAATGTSSALSDTRVDRALWVANAANRIAMTGKWGYIDYLGQVVDLHSRDPSRSIYADLPTALSRRAAIDGVNFGASSPGTFRVPEVERANRVYEALKQAGPPAHLIGSYLQDLLREGSKNLELNAALADNRLQVRTQFNNAERMRGVLEQTYDLAQHYPSYRLIVDEVYGGFFGAAVGDGAEKILRNNPSFANSQSISRLVEQSDGTNQLLEALKADVIRGFELQVDQLSDLREEYQESARRLSEQSSTNSDRLVAIMQESRTRAEAEKRAALDKTRIDALRAGTFILATILPNRRDAQILSTSVNAAIDVYQTFKSFQGNPENSAFAGAMSGTILTGNLLAIGMQIANAFAESGPTADQIIIQQLEQISRQISEFRQEVHGRFDRIDASLNGIFNEVVNGFADVQQAIRQSTAEIESAKRGLDRVAGRLSVLEQRIVARLDLLIEQSFRVAMTTCLHFPSIAGRELSSERYTECTLIIKNYLEESSSAALSGAWDSSKSYDFNVQVAAQSASLPGQVNFYRGLASVYGGYSFPGRVANPFRWAVAAQSYIALANDNPDNFRRQPVQILDHLTSAGRDIVQDFGSTLTVENSEKFVQLYIFLLEKYRISFDQVITASTQVRSRVLQSAGSTLDDVGLHAPATSSPIFASRIRDRPIPPISSTDPAFEKPSTGPSLDWTRGAGPEPSFTSDPSWPHLKATETIWDAIARTPVLANAEMLGLGTLEAGYQLVYREPRAVEATDAAMISLLFGKPNLIVDIYLKTGGTRRLVAQSLSAGGWEVFFFGRGLGRVAELLNRPIDMRQALTSSPLPFVTIAPFEIKDVHLAELVRARIADLATMMRQGLQSEANREGSELSAALDQVEYSVEILRGLTSLAFPNELERNDVIRRSLFGVATLPGLRNNDVRVSEHVEQPLMTRAIVLALLSDATFSGADQPERAGGPPRPTHELSEWALLRNLGSLRNEAAESLAQNVRGALTRARNKPDLLPLVEYELGRLTVLRHSHDVLLESR